LDFAKLDSTIGYFTSKKIIKKKEVHSKKLHNFGYTTTELLPPEKVIFNFSSRTLTEDEEFVLSKGLKFALPNRKLSQEKYLLCFEKMYKSLLEQEYYNPEVTSDTQSCIPLKDALRHLALSSWDSYYKKKPGRILTDGEWKALRSLSKDKSIIIARPDKGNGVVIVDRKDYINKVERILSDVSKFQKVDVDPFKISITTETKINNALRKLTKEDSESCLHESSYKEIYASGTAPGVLYGLPKVHKENWPIRPILSACNTPTYDLAKFLVPILNPITKNNFTVSNVFPFINELTQFKAQNTFMATFDVKSLFTQIPLNETIDICVNELFKYLDGSKEDEMDLLTVDYKGKHSYFTKKDFKKMLELASLDMHFIFNSTLYKQVDGVAMGSPLGPTLANAFMCYWEEKWLSDCPTSFKPLMYRRYVDDIFLIFSSPEHHIPFLQYLNSQHPNIEFTCEIEQNCSLPFLDVRITRDQSNLTTSLYRKPTFTGLLSKFSAFSPMLNKKNLVATLTYRAFKICSSFLNFHTEIEFLKNLFQINGYPISFVERQIKKTLDKFFVLPEVSQTPDDDVPTEAKSIMFMTYFLGDHSEKLRNDLRSLVRKYLPDIKLQVIFKSGSAIGDLFAFKDKLPESCVTKFIYKYTCESCNAFYIGKSQRQFKVRVFEHIGKSYHTGNFLGSPVHSEIRDHCRDKDHAMVPSNFVVIDKSRYKNDLLLLESLHQKIKKPSIGTHLQSTPLLSFD
jgi:hypothetical protein